MTGRVRRLKEQGGGRSREVRWLEWERLGGVREAGKIQRSNARGGMDREGQAEVRCKEEIETGEMGKTG